MRRGCEKLLFNLKSEILMNTFCFIVSLIQETSRTVNFIKTFNFLWIVNDVYFKSINPLRIINYPIHNSCKIE